MTSLVQTQQTILNPSKMPSMQLMSTMDPSKIMGAHVHTCYKSSSEWLHICEVERETGTTVLFRTYGEFWDLHRFVMDGILVKGGPVSERIVPFLDPPTRTTVSDGQALLRTQRLHFYLNTIVGLNLDVNIENHPFFNLKGVDYNDKMFTGSVELFRDLLQPQVTPLPLTVKIYCEGASHIWEQHEPLTIKNLKATISSFVPSFKKIYYRNEFQEKSLLQTDGELQLLSYKRFKLVFTVK